MNDGREAKTRRIEKYLDDNPEKRSVKDRFIEQFIYCEIECKNAILENWHSKGQHLDKETTEGIKLRFSLISKALGVESEYGFSDDFLMKVFGDKNNKNNPYRVKGAYSAKTIRDKITHELLLSAIDELYDRRDELFLILSQFREKF